MAIAGPLRYQNQRMQILIVDRSIAIIERLEELIVESGKPVSVNRAVSFEEAKKALKKVKYDALLLDINLPGNESQKLLKEVNKTSRETCVILLFTYIDSHIQQHYRSLGVDFFFDKYYDFEKICELLCALLHPNRESDLKT
jgi:DNA-binding NtrC family response regulator